MDYFNPVKLVFGSLVRRKITEECVGKSVLIICSSTAHNRYSKDPELSAFFSFSNVTFEHGFESNPSLTDIIEISSKYRGSSLDLIIGLGGGSAMDVAKISSASIPALQNGIHINDLIDDPDILSGVQEIDCIQIPTTAGTGSEVTPFATVWDYAEQQKKSLSHPKLYAKKAFIDPDFLSEIPIAVAVSTGLDALNQALESLWNVNASEFTRPLSRQAIIFSLQALPNISNAPSSSDLRRNLSLASLFAGLAISQTRTSICHSISYPLTLKYGVEHGMACAFSMLEVLNYNIDYIKYDVTLIRYQLNEDIYLILEDILIKYGVYDHLASLLPDKTSFLASIDDFVASGRFENNIKKCERTDLIQIISASFDSVKGKGLN